MTFGVGFALGALCAVMRLPIPAPPTVAGLLGIVGVTLGWYLISKVGGS